jgi:hypothetical protein
MPVAFLLGMVQEDVPGYVYEMREKKKKKKKGGEETSSIW